jgi:hypothetical protein
MRLGGLGKLIKIIHLIGSRHRDLPTCSVRILKVREGLFQVKIKGNFMKESDRLITWQFDGFTFLRNRVFPQCVCHNGLHIS